MSEKTPRAIEKLRQRKETHKDMHLLVRILWATGGFALLGAGLAMLVLPGPGLLVLALGLALLALEFAWAERLLERSLRGGMKLGGVFSWLRARPALLWPLVVLLLALAAGAGYWALQVL